MRITIGELNVIPGRTDSAAAADRKSTMDAAQHHKLDNANLLYFENMTTPIMLSAIFSYYTVIALCHFIVPSLSRFCTGLPVCAAAVVVAAVLKKAKQLRVRRQHQGRTLGYEVARSLHGAHEFIEFRTFGERLRVDSRRLAFTLPGVLASFSDRKE